MCTGSVSIDYVDLRTKFRILFRSETISYHFRIRHRLIITLLKITLAWRMNSRLPRKQSEKLRSWESHHSKIVQSYKYLLQTKEWIRTYPWSKRKQGPSLFEKHKQKTQEILSTRVQGIFTNYDSTLSPRVNDRIQFQNLPEFYYLLFLDYIHSISILNKSISWCESLL